jgi:hypothetical protein
VEGTRVTLGFSPDGRPLPARAGDGSEREAEEQRTREHLERQRAQAEAAQEAQRQWARGRDSLREALAGAQRVRDTIATQGVASLAPEELEEVRRSVYLAGAELLVQDAAVALGQYEQAARR